MIDTVFGKMYNESAGTGTVTAAHLENRIVQDDPSEVIMNRYVQLLAFVEYWLENYKRNTVKTATFNRLLISVTTLKNFAISTVPIGDINLFVLRCGTSDRRQLPMVKELCDDGRMKNMSIVLNGTEIRRTYGYSYGYGYGYGYYGYGYGYGYGGGYDTPDPETADE